MHTTGYARDCVPRREPAGISTFRSRGPIGGCCAIRATAVTAQGAYLGHAPSLRPRGALRPGVPLRLSSAHPQPSGRITGKVCHETPWRIPDLRHAAVCSRSSRFLKARPAGQNRRMSAVCITQAKASFTCQFFIVSSTVRMVEDGGPPGKEYRLAGRQSRKDPGGPLNCEQVVNIFEGPQNATFATGSKWVSYRTDGYFGNLGNFV